MAVIIKFTDGEVQIENLENSIFAQCPLFRNMLDFGFDNSAGQTIDFPALNKNFSKKEFDEYARYLSIENKNAFVFSREWADHVAHDPLLALNFVHFTNFVMDDDFKKQACQYALQTICQYDIEHQHLVEHIDTFGRFLSEEQFQSFLDLLFIRKRDSLNYQASPDNQLAQQSLKYILDRLAHVSPGTVNTSRANTSSNQRGECGLVFKTLAAKTLLVPASLDTDTVESLQNKLAPKLSELYQNHVYPHQVKLIFCGNYLRNDDLRSGEVLKHACIHTLLDLNHTLIQEKTLNCLDENDRFQIEIVLANVASFTDKILHYNNNFGHNADIYDTFKETTNNLILLKQQIESKTIQSDRKKELLRAFDLALIYLNDAQHHIHLYGKLFNQGILIGNIPKEIRSIESFLRSNPLKNQNSLNQFEAKAFDTLKLILRSIISINTSDIKLNEEQQYAREILHEQMMRYLRQLNGILQNACREVVLPTNTLFDVTELLNDTTSIVDSSPISLPQANNRPVSKKLDAPIVVAIDHGGVLDGVTCDSQEENRYVNSQTDLIWKRDDKLGLTYFLPDGVAILQRLNELAQKGVVISSHSNNVFEDQLELFRGLKQAAESKGLPFPQLGRLAIYQRNHEASADNPQYASINDPILGSIETLTFGQVKSETGEVLEVPRNGWGKEHIRQIIATSYGIPKENLHVFDDAGGICSVAGSEGHTAYWCGQRDVDVADAVKDIDHQDDITYEHRGTQMSLSKQTFLIHLNTMLASLRFDTVQQVISVDTASVAQSNHNIIEDDIIMHDTIVDSKLLHDLILEDNVAVNDLIGLFGHNPPEQLFEAACHPDEAGMPLLHKIVLNKSDREALQLVQFLTYQININLIPIFQAAGEEEDISLEDRAFLNGKSEVGQYLRNLRKANPMPITDADQKPIDVPPRAPLVVPGFDGLKKRSREPVQTSQAPVDGNKISKKTKRSEEENPQPDTTTNTSSWRFGRLWALPGHMLDAATNYLISVSPQLNSGDADSNTAEDHKKHKREPRQ